MSLMLTAVCMLTCAAPGASLDCGTATLELDARGCLASFRDRTGREWALPGEPFCVITAAAGEIAPESLERDGDQLAVRFPGGALLRYTVTEGPGYLLFALTEATGLAQAGVTALRHCALRLEGLSVLGDPMNAFYDDRWAVAVMSTQVNVRGYPLALGTAQAELRAESYDSHGLTPAGFGIVAAPRAEFEETIARFEDAADLPSPRPGGQWGKASDAAHHSYLFITALHESDVDEVIAWAHRGGFDTVLIGETWSRSHGHHEINTDSMPDGLPSLQRVADKLHAAGLRVGLHFLGAAVYLNDPYVTPAPDRRLVVDARATLAGPVDDRSDFLPTVEAPAGFPTEDGGYMGKGLYVRVDDEIIRYATPRTEPPFGLAGCTRGALGTTAAAHEAGEAAEHLQRSYGYFLYDLDSSLAEEVTGNVCRVANAIGADMLYFDGSELLQGDHWYYNAKLQNLYYRGLTNKDTFLQGSSYSHYSWHLISRMASADGHGDVKGYLDERLPWLASYRANLMPSDIGWYYVYDPQVTADQFDYILQKCLGYNSSISVQTNPTQLRSHPEIGAIFDLVGTYERLRRAGRLPATTLARLREPKREYRLLREPLRLRRTVFGEWTPLRELGPAGAALPLTPAGAGARLGLELRCGALERPAAAYREGSLLLEDFDDVAGYSGSTSEGVTQSLTTAEGGPEGGRCGQLTATSTRTDDGGWSCLGRSFGATLDLAWHKGIGFWLKGDGQGGAFKLQIRDPQHATDYYITNDFTEWRYFQVLRPDRPQPEEVDYSRIASVLLYYNGLPGGKTVTCWVDGIRALRELDEAEIVNPSLTLGGARVTIPVTLRAGERLVYHPGQFPVVIPATAGERRALAAVPDLVLGDAREATLAAEVASAALEARLVQDLPEEVPLEEE